MKLSEKQKEVFKAAKNSLQGKSWYKGICMDNFPTDKEIERDGIESAVQQVCMETEMWDAWDDEGFIPLRQAVEQDKLEKTTKSLDNRIEVL